MKYLRIMPQLTTKTNCANIQVMGDYKENEPRFVRQMTLAEFDRLFPDEESCWTYLLFAAGLAGHVARDATMITFTKARPDRGIGSAKSAAKTTVRPIASRSKPEPSSKKRKSHCAFRSRFSTSCSAVKRG